MYVDDLGCIDRLPLSITGPLARSAPREFLTGIARLAQARSTTFPQLFAAFDTDADGKLSLVELEALSREAVGPPGGSAARYFQVGVARGRARVGWGGAGPGGHGCCLAVASVARARAQLERE